MDDEISKPSTTLYVSVFTSLCGAIAMGTTVGWSPPALPDMGLNGSHPYLDPVRDVEMRSLIGSATNLGGLCGALLAGLLANLLGRRTCIAVVAFPFFLSWIPIWWGSSLTWVLSGRVLTGFFAAICSSVVPMYICEIAPAHIRGQLGFLWQLFTCLGLLFDSLLGCWVSWKILSAVASLPLVPLLIVMPWLPESPSFLLSRDFKKNPSNSQSKSFSYAEFTSEESSTQAAHQALARLRSRTANVDHELKEMIQNLEQQDEAYQCFIQRTYQKIRRPEGYKPLLLAVGLMICQQGCGVTAILFFQKDIFASASKTLNANLASVIVLSAMMLTTLCASFVVDRLGRKLLLASSGLIHTFSLAVLGGFYWVKSHDQSWADQYAIIPVVCLVTFFIGLSIGYGPVPWCMIAELSPQPVRGLVSSVAVTVNWTSAFLVTRYFTALQTAFGGAHGAFWLFSGISLLSVGFAVWVLPETRGRSLADIQLLYQNKRSKKVNLQRSLSADKTHSLRPASADLRASKASSVILVVP